MSSALSLEWVQHTGTLRLRYRVDVYRGYTLVLVMQPEMHAAATRSQSVLPSHGMSHGHAQRFCENNVQQIKRSEA